MNDSGPVDWLRPLNVFELVPKLMLQMEPALGELDRLLGDDVVFRKVKADLLKRYPNSDTRGRHSTPVEVVVRMLVVRRLYSWSYKATEHNVNDSLVLRQFCCLYLEPAPDDTTLIHWAALIGSGTGEPSRADAARQTALPHPPISHHKLLNDALNRFPGEAVRQVSRTSARRLGDASRVGLPATIGKVLRAAAGSTVQVLMRG